MPRMRSGGEIAIAFAIIVTLAWLFVIHCAISAHGKELVDCANGCSNAVVREIPISARRPYSKENLTAFSYAQPFMPPLQYDHPYQGIYTVTRVNEREMKLVCPSPAKAHVILACADIRLISDISFQRRCHIYMVDDITLKAMGWNYDIVLRHELAHCNGWPWTHPGIERPNRDDIDAL